MPMHPELRGSRLPRISMATAALVALTVRPIDSQTPNHLQYVSSTRPVSEHISSHRIVQHARAARTEHNPRHSQTHLTRAQKAARTVTAAELAAWTKVHNCEEPGNWYVRGSSYSGGLGISNTNWTYYAPKYMPKSAADATPKEQVFVAMRIQKNPPDQNGCNGSW